MIFLLQCLTFVYVKLYKVSVIWGKRCGLIYYLLFEKAVQTVGFECLIKEVLGVYTSAVLNKQPIKQDCKYEAILTFELIASGV